MGYLINGSTNSVVSSRATISVKNFAPGGTVTAGSDLGGRLGEYITYQDEFSNYFLGTKSGGWLVGTGGKPGADGKLPTQPPPYGKFFILDLYTPTWPILAGPINIKNNINTNVITYFF
jgi:hypothetical protein